MTSPRQIIAVPTVTKLDETAVGAVVVGGSHAAIFTTYLTVDARAHAAIQHDACIGLDEAGIGGLEWAEQFGFAMAAIDGRTARIGDGDDMFARGLVSRVNAQAEACGVTSGMTCREAAELLRTAAEPASRPAPLAETRQDVTLDGGVIVTAMDSVALANASDRGRIIATGSHGGQPSAGYAAKIAPGLVLFNDAGPCAEDSGVASFATLDSEGIAAAAVSAFSARIGDGRSTLMSGIISAANRSARDLGARIGHKASDFARRAAKRLEG